MTKPKGKLMSVVVGMVKPSQMPVHSEDRKNLIERFGQEQASVLNPALSLDVDSNQGTTLGLDL